MGSLLQPTGSEPPQVYWRRRLVVVAVALVLVVGLIWMIWPRDSAAGQAGSAPSVTVPAAVQPSVSADASASASSTAVSSAKPSTSASPTGPQACAAESLRVDLAGYQKVKQSAKQTFKVSITNTGTVVCILDLTAKNFALTITSGKDRIWSTDDCAQWVPAKKQNLKPQKGYEFDLTWKLVRSKATCKTTGDTVGAGTYVAKATLGSASPGRLVMVITTG
jgi:hypothetical protein